MPALRELQADVLRALLGRTNRAAALVRPGGIEPQRRLAVYRNNHRESLCEALAAVYPTLVRLVGAAFFRHAALEFIAAHPPASGNLHDYGADMASFLGSFAAVASLPYLADVARLEWAWHEVFHAQATAASDAAEVLGRIARMAPHEQAAVRLRLQPASRLVASRYPVSRIWEANLHDEPPLVQLDEGGEHVLVVQRDGDVVVESIESAEHALLLAFNAGHSLGDALGVALSEKAMFDAPAAIAQRLADGTLVEPPQVTPSPACGRD
jgi:hypothetical protein